MPNVSCKTCMWYNPDNSWCEINYFYYNKQFNAVYNFWKLQEKDNTYYDWAKLLNCI